MRDISKLNPPDNWEKEITRLIKRREKVVDQENLIVLYGSSSIRLWVHASDDLAPLNILNFGFGGSSFAWCYRFFSHLFEGLKPKHIILYAGENDLSQGASVQRVFDDFKKLVGLITDQHPSTLISLAGIKSSPSREALQDKFDEFNALGRQFIEQWELGNYFETGYLLKAAKSTDTSLFLSDGLHLNRKGYQQWSKAFKKHLGLT